MTWWQTLYQSIFLSILAKMFWQKMVHPTSSSFLLLQIGPFVITIPWGFKLCCDCPFSVPGGWMDLDSGKTEWLWVQETSGSSCLSSLVMDGVALFQTAPLHNQRFSWTHNCCSKSKWQLWLGGPLHNFVLCVVVPLPGLWGPAHSHSWPSYFSWITAVQFT